MVAILGMRLSFEIVQILLHSGIENAQGLIGRGHHVNTIGFALGAFLVHELVHWPVSRRTLENHIHHQKQRYTQRRKSAFGDASIHLARLVRRRIKSCKGYECLLGIKPPHITNFSTSYGPRTGPTLNIPITTGYSGNDTAKGCISFLSTANAAEAAWSWDTACFTRSSAVAVLGMTPKCPQAEV